MALTLPTSGSVNTGKLVLPTDPDAEQVLQHVQKLNTYKLQDRAAAAEASIPFSTRFAEALGQQAAGIGQGIARSFIATGKALTTGKLDEPFVPTEGYEKALVGDKPVSFKTIGEEYTPLLEKIGVSSKTADKLKIPLGLFVGAMDIVPIGGGKKQAFDQVVKEVGINVAKTADENLITKELSRVVKGPESSMKSLVATLKNVDNPSDAVKLIDASMKEGSLARGTVAIKAAEPSAFTPELKSLANDVVTKQIPKETFLSRYAEGFRNFADDATRKNLTKELNALSDAGFTPEKFYDLVAHGGNKAIDRVGREILGVVPSKRVVTTDTALLKERLSALSRGAKEGVQATKESIHSLQTDVIRLIQRNLPTDFRGSLLTAVRNANDVKKLGPVLDRLTTSFNEFNALKTVSKELGSRRSKLAFLKKVGEFNNIVVQDVKKQLGITNAVKKMSKEELDRVLDEVRNRIGYKAKEGLMLPKVKSGAPAAPEGFYNNYLPPNTPMKTKALNAASDSARNIKNIGDEYLGVISTQLANIDKSLKYGLRKFEYQSRRMTDKDLHVAANLSKKIKAAKLSDQDFRQLDVALKHGFWDDAMAIAKKNGFSSELEATRPMLDDILKRAKQTGIEVDARKNFWPRQLKSDHRSIAEFENFLEKSNVRGLVEKALRERERVLGRVLSKDEEMKIINSLFRGFRQAGITLSTTGALKRRLIETIDPEIAHLYENSLDALSNYIQSTNNLIESRKFFGKHMDFANVEADANLNDIISTYVMNLVAKKDLPTVEQQQLRRILEARFNNKQMNSTLSALKNIGYLTVMNSPLNALTQLGDLAWTFYRAGTGKALYGIKDAISKGRITREDIGISEIAQEISDDKGLGDFVSRMFKATGLNRIDRLGKESFINGVARSLQSDAIRDTEGLVKRITPIFGEETDSVVKDLAAGNISENVKYLLFNELLDFQPVALSEVPLKYLESPNGRIFYALKTYTTKLFDVYRREVVQQIKSDPKQATKNLVRLSSFLMLFNGIANEVQQAITGQDVSLEDNIVDSMAKAVGFNRYTGTQISKEGIGSALAGQILPPTQLADDLSKDFMDVFVNPPKNPDDQGISQLRSIRDIPVGGKLYYWWFGRGAPNPEKAKGSSFSIPQVDIPSVNIPTLKL